MFDIDGTLIDSEKFDSEFFIEAVEDAFGIRIEEDWSSCKYVTDSGIVSEIIEKHDLTGNKSELIDKVKKLFISKVAEYLTNNQLTPIPGANDFLEHLLKLDNVKVATVTGGWLETATLKLKNSGFNLGDLQITSSNDHYCRTEIMKIAQARTCVNHFHTKTYFGDRDWDKIACSELGCNSILVGNYTKHSQQINDFSSVKDAIRYIGL